MEVFTNIVLCAYTFTTCAVTNPVVVEFTDGTKGHIVRENVVKDVSPRFSLLTIKSVWDIEPCLNLSASDLKRIFSSISQLGVHNPDRWGDSIPITRNGRYIGFLSKDRLLESLDDISKDGAEVHQDSPGSLGEEDAHFPLPNQTNPYCANSRPNFDYVRPIEDFNRLFPEQEQTYKHGKSESN